MKQYLLSIDQGTTNSRAIVFDSVGRLIAQHELPLSQLYPDDGWVEQDPVEIVEHTITCCREVIKKVGIDADAIAAIGITNQRETTIIWDKKTGSPIYPAIVWQDRRTASMCRDIRQDTMASSIRQKTGLLIDPYFSATKIKWILDNVPLARSRAEAGELLFGTIDTFILWRLTRGQSHFTDASNASRTMLYNIHTQQWDEDILKFFQIPKILLPEVKENTADFGVVHPDILGRAIPITAMAGDQHAATVGQACFSKGMIKMTYGTGGFMMLNTGHEPIASNHQLLTTIAYKRKGETSYALEGSIFSTGVTIKWLRDTLGMIHSAAQTQELASSLSSNEGVYLIPAFTGLGAPYWDPEARGALLGLTRQSGIAQIARAALESVCFQTKDLLTAIQLDSEMTLKVIRVDGGMSANNWLLQFLADMLNIEVQRPKCIETTALGVAYLAGLQIGLFKSFEEITQLWEVDATFFPKINPSEREAWYGGWKKAVARIVNTAA